MEVPPPPGFSLACYSYLNRGFNVCGRVGRMSFQVIVKLLNGEATVTTSGDVPDGELSVNGHEDESLRTLTVARRGPDGRYVQQATATHHKEV